MKKNQNVFTRLHSDVFKLSAVLLSSLALVSTSQGATWFQSYSSGNWDSITWGSGNGTGSGASFVEDDGDVYIDVNSTVTLGHTQTIGTLTLQRNNGNGQLNLHSASANLTVTGNATIGGQVSDTLVGTLDVSDGSISVGGVTTINTNGVFNLSGGSYSSGGTTVHGNVNLSGGSITDSGASLFSASSNLAFDFGGLDGSSMVTWDATDISIIDGATLSLSGLDSLAIGSYDLMTFTGSFAGDYDGDYTLDGLSDGLAGSIAYDSDSVYLNVVAAVPEPTSAALLSIGTLGFLMKRRR